MALAAFRSDVPNHNLSTPNLGVHQPILGTVLPDLLVEIGRKDLHRPFRSFHSLSVTIDWPVSLCSVHEAPSQPYSTCRHCAAPQPSKLTINSHYEPSPENNLIPISQGQSLWFVRSPVLPGLGSPAAG
jgi:hypothetical protein